MTFDTLTLGTAFSISIKLRGNGGSNTVIEFIKGKKAEDSAEGV